ncbi:hypothetical protein H632_c291p2, partial [Helicosporidium sp. ATCC 50920]
MATAISQEEEQIIKYRLATQVVGSSAAGVSLFKKLAVTCLELKEAVAASHAPPSKDAPPPLVADLVAELERDLYA